MSRQFMASQRLAAVSIPVADFAVVTIISIVAIIGNPDAFVAAFVVPRHIAAAIATVITAFHNPATGKPDVHGYSIPVAVWFAIIATIARHCTPIVDDDGCIVRRIVVMMAVVNGGGDDQPADKSADDGEAFIAGRGRFWGEGKSGDGDESKSGEFCFHKSPRLGSFLETRLAAGLFNLFCIRCKVKSVNVLRLC